MSGEAEADIYTVGALGPIVFSVSEAYILTLQDLVRSSAGRWAQHDIIGQKPKKEWLGPGVDTVTFSIRFSWEHGLNPRKAVDRLTELERAGRALPLVIGNKGVGTGLWVITNMTQAWEQLDNRGNVRVAKVDLTLEEYVK
ncbi:hypothetical protein H70357_31715 [Paenibacillus sp. FSL H7-0357]|uniref:phage tail protein n=1 Tax=unclassified Paenibacillus TaxID=185978 RepID=UPI0004F5EB35|nr:phage tail protein [Paenibacillus sp. FSL H7-0357]AIQ20724.1 hypothetical protein H70357_31715 [Paenibacillus sp. FSL H7-0357]